MNKRKEPFGWITILKATGIAVGITLLLDFLCYILSSNSMLFSEIFG